MVIARRKYALCCFIQTLDFSLETLQYELNLDESLEKKMQRSYEETKGILLPRNYLKFPFVKVIASRIAYQAVKHEK
eukprot:UN26945